MKATVKMNLPSRKKMNRERLEEIADISGDHMLTEMFWSMFDDLSATNQEYYVKKAAEIVKNHTGIDYYKIKKEAK